MLKVLGSKRVLFLAILLASIIGVGGIYFYVLTPFHDQTKQDLDSTKAAIDQKYTDVAKMKEQYVFLQSQLRSFKELEGRGFFNDQNRSPAVDKLGRLSDYAGLLKANLKFGIGQLIKDPSATLAKQVVLKSPVTVEIKSVDDVDVYSFIKFVDEKFSGDVDVTSVKLKRNEIFNIEILKKIGTGSGTPLVDTELHFDWYTLAPENVIAPVGNGVGNGPSPENGAGNAR